MFDHILEGTFIPKSYVYHKSIGALHVIGEISCLRIIIGPNDCVNSLLSIFIQPCFRHHLENAGNLLHHIDRFNHKIVIYERLGNFHSTGTAPVSKAPFPFSVAYHQIIDTVFFQILDITAHSTVHFLQRRRFSIMLIIAVRYRYNSAAPSTGAAAAAGIRGRVLYVSGFTILAIGNITHPFAHKIMVIQRKQSSLHRQLSIAGVTTPFEMRTVRRDSSVHIAKHRMNKSIMYPVQHRMRTFERRTHGHIAVDDSYMHDIRFSADRKIAESIPRKSGMYTTAFSVTDYLKTLPVHIQRIQQTIMSQIFGESHFYFFIRFAIVFQDDPAGHIFAGIIDFSSRIRTDQPGNQITADLIPGTILNLILCIHIGKNSY